MIEPLSDEELSRLRENCKNNPSYRYTEARLIATLDREKARAEHLEMRTCMSGMGEPCFWCDVKLDPLAGNPGVWPMVVVPPGVPAGCTHHVCLSCVQERIFRAEEVEALRELESAARAWHDAVEGVGRPDVARRNVVRALERLIVMRDARTAGR
jgi:hypothetical protein